MRFTNTPLDRFRIIAFLEGLSYLILLGIAMPLKYMADMPLAVKYVGWAHGVLFVLYMVTLAHAAREHRWSLLKVALAFVASLVPFGTFWLDRRLTEGEFVLRKRQ